MSSTALQLYWSHAKSFTKSYWKYFASFAVGSLISSIFSIWFTKKITGLSTKEFIWACLIAKEKQKYRNIIHYDGYCVKDTSPIRPSTACIAQDSFWRKITKNSPMDYKTTAEQFLNQYKTYQKQDADSRKGIRNLPQFVPDPKEIIIKQNSFNNTGALKAYLLTYPGCNNENGVIFYIHGGAFYLGAPSEAYQMLCIMSQYLGCTALAIDYHYCPEISLPQQVDECIEGYKYLIDEMKVDPFKIFIAGASAGATLSLLVIQKIKQLKLPNPCGAILISGAYDCTYKTALNTEQKEKIIDAMCPIVPNFFTICIDDDDRKEYDTGDKDMRYRICAQAKYSPINGDFDGLCPLYITASLQEVMINDSKLLLQKCKENNVEYGYDFDPFLLHCTIIWAKYIPEARDKLIIAIEWMKQQLNKSNQ